MTNAPSVEQSPAPPSTLSVKLVVSTPLTGSEKVATTLVVLLCFTAPSGGSTAVTCGGVVSVPPPLAGKPSGTEVSPLPPPAVVVVSKLHTVSWAVQLPAASHTGAATRAV